MAYKKLYFVVWLLLMTVSQFSIGNPNDSLKASQYIDYKFNFIQFYERNDFDKFYAKWKNQRIAIAHFGDSHVQPDIYSGKVRYKLQQVKGDGGLGMVFPYSIANTYSSVHYSSSHTGLWMSAKSIARKPELPLGMSGITARTLDENATFTITFKNQIPGAYKKLLIFCKQDKNSFDLEIISGSEKRIVSIDESNSGLPYVEIDMPISQAIEVKLKRSSEQESEFELYGLSLLSEENEGLVLHAMGIGGSQYGSLLREKLFDVQFPSLEADVVILDFGTNDFLYANAIPATLKSEIIDVINKVRKSAPESVILLTSAQDMFRKGINTTASATFSDLIRSIAREQHCLFYDWYWVSGGPEKMISWQKAGLAQQDLIHLTLKGYERKGDLFAQAIENTINWYESEKIDSLLIKPDPIIPAAEPQLVLVKKKETEPAIGTSIHQIEKGESLYSIARKYNMTVAEVMEINQLTSTLIIAGKTLKVKANGQSEKAVAQSAPSATITRHKIQAGETLGQIAEKYHVSMRSIKKANGLKSSKIIAGKMLIIPPQPTSKDES